MKKYTIAERFPSEIRKIAVSLDYQVMTGDSDVLRALWDGQPICPLGACLRVMGMPVEYNEPSARDVVEALINDWDPERIEEEAREFISDWDAGLITDLAYALEVGDDR